MLVYANNDGHNMDALIQDNGREQFAVGQNNLDLRLGSNVEGPGDQFDPERPLDRIDSGDRLEALKHNDSDERYRRIELPDAPDQKNGASGGGRWLSRTT